MGIRTLLLVLFTCVMQHTAVLLGNSSTLNKRGENPPRFRRTTPAALSLANPLPSAQTLFSFSAVMAFHEALTIKDWPMCIVQTICEELEENEFVEKAIECYAGWLDVRQNPELCPSRFRGQ